MSTARVGRGIKPRFEDYADRYEHLAMERRDGILQVTLHTDGGSHVWTGESHDELGYAFTDIAADRENQVMIFTGAGDAFINEIDANSFDLDAPRKWDNVMFEGQRLLNNLIAIPIPVIGVANGPVTIHPELVALSDVVIASELASFHDFHFAAGVAPGDGAHIVWTHLLGPNRGRYFLLTGQTIDAQEALRLGVVGEVVPHDKALERAWEVARDVMTKPLLSRRYARAALTIEWKRLFFQGLERGLALEGLALSDSTEGLQS
jgi:enoyl-CoA hydratase/carnithine racemase